VVRRCYESLTSVDKERLLDSMSISPTFTGPASQSSREIKSLITTVHLDLYRSGVSEWRALIVKQKRAEIMLAELERGTEAKPAPGSSTSGRTSAKTKAPVDEIDEIFPPEDKKKKDRKSPNAPPAISPSPSAEPLKSQKISKSPVVAPMVSVKATEGEGQNEEQKKKRKRKRPSSSSASAAFAPPQQATSAGSVPIARAEQQQSLDMNKIRTLQSGKMISIKRITEQLEGDLSRKKKRS
jgi:hypothetical protein